MPKYQVTVEAHQWFKNGDHPDDYSKSEDGFLDDGTPHVFTAEQRKANGLEGSVVRYFRDPDIPGDYVCQVCQHTMHDHGWLDKEDDETVCPGDYILKDRLGNYYVCQREVFEQLYDPVDD